MRRPKANVRIRQAMRANERAILARIKKYGHFRTDFCSVAWHNAIDRLQAAGVIRYAQSKRFLIGGYVLKGHRFVDRRAS